MTQSGVPGESGGLNAWICESKQAGSGQACISGLPPACHEGKKSRDGNDRLADIVCVTKYDHSQTLDVADHGA
jgi:hypothetical protein